jgi:hypothetical protein
MPRANQSGIPHSAKQGSRDMKDTYRYVIHAYEDVRQKRPMKHEHGGTTVLTDGAEALGRAEVIAKEFPGGWVYIHLEYRGEKV